MKRYNDYVVECMKEMSSYHEARRCATHRFYKDLRDELTGLSQKEYFAVFEQAEYELDEEGHTGDYDDALADRMRLLHFGNY